MSWIIQDIAVCRDTVTWKSTICSRVQFSKQQLLILNISFLIRLHKLWKRVERVIG